MPRVSREQTDLNREAIESVSARLFREQGLKGVSVADLMSAAGLTHGGFYGHFASKDALAAVACEHAFDQSAERREKRLKDRKDGQSALASFVTNYLSARHRDDPGQGCAAAALATDVARETQDKPIRQAYAAGIHRMANMIESLSAAEAIEAAAAADPAGPTDSENASARRTQALVQMTMLVGALTLARATKGDPISDELLAAVRGHFADLPNS